MNAGEEAEEGFQAFIRLEAGLRRLEGALPELRQALGGEAGRIEDAARNASQTLSGASGRVLEAAGRLERSGRRQALWLALGSGLGLLLAAGGAYWQGSRSGWTDGRAAGLQEVRDEASAASWTNTPAGKLAWRMETAAPGTLAALAQCGRPGWKIEVRDKRRMCWPYTAPDRSQYGWEVP